MAAAPTGCFKCGRPGHWSRDCPSAPGSKAANPSPSFPRPPPAKAAAAEGEEGKGKGKGQKKKERATRPKLTADLLLSDDGLGYALRHFPKAFKCHGRPGHEVEELGNLIRLYMEWHSRLIPYYSFEQFVRKVEQVGASKRVRTCITELKERVAKGGDLTILHEPPVVEVMPECDPDSTAPEGRASGTAAPSTDNLDAISAQEDIDTPLETNDVDPMQEDLLNEIYRGTAGEPQGPAGEVTRQEAPQPSASTEEDLHGDPSRDAQNHQDQATPAVKPGKMQVTDEQRARMEANRLKALERAAARARASQP